MDDLDKLTEEHRKLFSEDEKNILKLAPFMQRLVASEDWRQFHAIGTAQVGLHIEALLQPAATRDMDMFRKGIIFGVKTLLATPEGILNTKQSLVEKLPKGEVAEVKTPRSEDDTTEGVYAPMNAERPHGE